MSLCLKDNRSSFSQVSLKPETKDVDWKVHKQLFCCVCKRHDFWKTKIWCQTTWRWTILCLMLNSWIWTNLENIFGNWLLVPQLVDLRYPRYAPEFQSVVFLNSPNDLFKNWKKLLFWYYGQKFIVYTCHFFNIRITRCRAQMYITLPLAVESDCGDAQDGNIGTYVDIHLFYNKKLCIWLRKRHMVKTGTIQKLSFLIFFEMELFWECWNPTC